MPSSGGVRPSPTGTPNRRISPESRRTRPAIARISVVLPAPFGPSSARSSPWRSSNEAPSSALTAPKDFVALMTDSTFMSAPYARRRGFLDDPGEWRTGSGGWRSVNAVEIGDLVDAVEIRDPGQVSVRASESRSNGLADP